MSGGAQRKADIDRGRSAASALPAAKCPSTNAGASSPSRCGSAIPETPESCRHRRTRAMTARSSSRSTTYAPTRTTRDGPAMRSLPRSRNRYVRAASAIHDRDAKARRRALHHRAGGNTRFVCGSATVGRKHGRAIPAKLIVLFRPWRSEPTCSPRTSSKTNCAAR